MKKHKLLANFTILLIVIAFFGMRYNSLKERSQLAELAYTNNKDLGIVYLYENGLLEPYFVLEDNYLNQGNVLLLRKHLLDVSTNFQKSRGLPDYENSHVDVYLHEQLPNYFSSDFYQSIPFTTINIVQEFQAVTINRKFFSLAEYEVFPAKRFRFLANNDGSLNFFEKENTDKGMAYTNGGILGSWWLRSTSIKTIELAHIVGYDGTKTGGFLQQTMAYIRPAFTLPPETPIKKVVQYGKEMYIIPESR